jgi:hypothetical protein
MCAYRSPSLVPGYRRLDHVRNADASGSFPLATRRFVRRQRLNVESVDRTRKLFFERNVYCAVTLYSGQSGESVRDNFDAEMRFPFRASAGVSFVKVRLVDHRQGRRRKRRLEFLSDAL